MLHDIKKAASVQLCRPHTCKTAAYTLYFTELLPLPQMNTIPAKNKAVFLDRDGVLNKEMGDYVCRLEDFHVLEHNIKPLKSLQDRGYLLIVATNQGGLAKGWYTEDELAKMHAQLRDIYGKHGVAF